MRIAPLVLALALSGSAKAEDLSPIIKNLGSESFSVREDAYKLLGSKINNSGITEDVRRHMPHDDPEVQFHLRRFLEDYWNIMPSNYYRLPFIDSLPMDYKGRSDIISDNLRKSNSLCHDMPGFVSPPDNEDGQLSDWPKYRAATRFWTTEMLDGGMPRQEIIKLLNTMAEREMRIYEHRITNGSFDWSFP